MSFHQVGHWEVSLTTPEANIKRKSSQRTSQKVRLSWLRATGLSKQNIQILKIIYTHKTNSLLHLFRLCTSSNLAMVELSNCYSLTYYIVYMYVYSTTVNQLTFSKILGWMEQQEWSVIQPPAKDYPWKVKKILNFKLHSLSPPLHLHPSSPFLPLFTVLICTIIIRYMATYHWNHRNTWPTWDHNKDDW